MIWIVWTKHICCPVNTDIITHTDWKTLLAHFFLTLIQIYMKLDIVLNPSSCMFQIIRIMVYRIVAIQETTSGEIMFVVISNATYVKQAVSISA